MTARALLPWDQLSYFSQRKAFHNNDPRVPIGYKPLSNQQLRAVRAGLPIVSRPVREPKLRGSITLPLIRRRAVTLAL